MTDSRFKLVVLALTSLALLASCGRPTLMASAARVDLTVLSDQATSSDSSYSLPIRLKNSGNSQARFVELRIENEKFDLSNGVESAGFLGDCKGQLDSGETCVIWNANSPASGTARLMYKTGSGDDEATGSWDFGGEGSSGSEGGGGSGIFGMGTGSVIEDMGGADEIESIVTGPVGEIYGVGTIVDGGDGDIGIIKTDEDGEKDETYGDSGTVAIDVGTGSDDRVYASALQNDGKLLVVGSSDGDMMAVRLDSTGVLDNTFAAAGKLVTDLTALLSSSTLYDVKVETGGSIFAFGTLDTSLADPVFLAVKIDGTGTIDGGFGSLGIGLIGSLLVGSSDRARAGALLDGGALIAAGSSLSLGGARDSALVKLTALGQLDGSFGSSGKVVLDLCGLGEDDEILDITVASDGKLVVVGFCENGTDRDAVIARFTSAGLLDATFGVGGVVRFDPQSGGEDQLEEVVIGVGGVVAVGKSENHALAVYLDATGVGVTTFGSNGVYTGQPGASTASLKGLAVSATRLIAGGFSLGATTDFLLLALDL